MISRRKPWSQSGGQLRAEHLHGDLPLVFQVLGEIDGGHAARNKFFLDDIAIGEGGFEAVMQVWHCVLAPLATVLEYLVRVLDGQAGRR